MQRNEPSACNSPSMLIVLWTQLYLISCTNFAVFLAKGDCQKCALYEKKIKELQEQMRSKDVSLNELMKISMKMEKQISQQVFLLLAILAVWWWNSLCSKKSTPDLICCKYTYKTIPCVAESNARFWDLDSHYIEEKRMYFKRTDVIVKMVYWMVKTCIAQGYIHTAPFSFLSVFWWWKRCPFTVLRFQMNFYENDRRSHCFSKILLIPSS